MTPPFVSLQDLSKTYRSQTHTVDALVSFSLTVRPKESWGILGESGCGKTTLGKILAGHETPTRGSISFEGKSWREMNRRDRARWVQMIFQDPFSSLNPKLPVGVQLTEAARVAHPTHAKQRATDGLTRVGLPASFMDRYPHQLSGGQRQRVAIARALAPEPRLLIADEPVSSLDVSVQAHILKLLKELQNERSFALLFISHDWAVVANTCDQALVMKSGRTVEQGTIRQLLSAPQQPYTQSLLNATPVL